MTDLVIPPLPAAPVDFNTLHDSLAAGDSPEMARAKAIAVGAGREVPTFTGLSHKTKAQLLKIATDEKVQVPSDVENEVIVTTIEASRLAYVETGTRPDVALEPTGDIVELGDAAGAPDGAD